MHTFVTELQQMFSNNYSGGSNTTAMGLRDFSLRIASVLAALPEFSLAKSEWTNFLHDASRTFAYFFQNYFLNNYVSVQYNTTSGQQLAFFVDFPREPLELCLEHDRTKETSPCRVYLEVPRHMRRAWDAVLPYSLDSALKMAVHFASADMLFDIVLAQDVDPSSQVRYQARFGTHRNQVNSSMLICYLEIASKMLLRTTSLRLYDRIQSLESTRVVSAIVTNVFVTQTVDHTSGFQHVAEPESFAKARMAFYRKYVLSWMVYTLERFTFLEAEQVFRQLIRLRNSYVNRELAGCFGVFVSFKLRYAYLRAVRLEINSVTTKASEVLNLLKHYCILLQIGTPLASYLSSAIFEYQEVSKLFRIPQFHSVAGKELFYYYAILVNKVIEQVKSPLASSAEKRHLLSKLYVMTSALRFEATELFGKSALVDQMVSILSHMEAGTLIS